jgi:hypothetical protein
MPVMLQNVARDLFALKLQVDSSNVNKYKNGNIRQQE